LFHRAGEKRQASAITASAAHFTGSFGEILEHKL